MNQRLNSSSPLTSFWYYIEIHRINKKLSVYTSFKNCFTPLKIIRSALYCSLLKFQDTHWVTEVVCQRLKIYLFRPSPNLLLHSFGRQNI
jgi:hypothetical protein